MATAGRNPLSTPLGTRVLAVAVALGALAFGLDSIATWIGANDVGGAGGAPGAHAWTARWPLALLALPPIALAVALARRAGAVGLALAGVSWALGVNVLCELPWYTSSHWVFDGPFLAPLYVALTLGAMLYGAGLGPGSGHERACALFALWCTANGKLFAREGDAVYAWLVVGALVAFAATPRAAPSGARPVGRPFVIVVALFLAWLLVTALAGDNLGVGLSVWSRCLAGALFAWSAAAGLDRTGARRVVLALAVGGVASLAAAAWGVLDTASVVGWERVQGTRLRVFDQHANGTGPLFATSACLFAALALRPRGAARAAWGALALLAGLATFATDSRASLLGLGVGAAALAWALWGRVPRRPLAWAAGAIALAAVLVALLVAPPGAPLRARLDAASQGQSALGQRWHFWKMAASAARENPLFGVGPNQYYVHAQYAEPSYYDRTPQTLHAHDLPLGVLEGTGWIGLALFVALAVLLWSRACAALRAGADGGAQRGARVEAAALLAMAAALFGANLLDLGQSQTTLVPLLAWIALGAWTALARADAPATPGATSGLRGWIALALAAPLAALPLASNAHYARARAAMAADAFDVALAGFERTLAWNPLERRAHLWAATASAALGDHRGRIDHLEAACESAPQRADAWHDLAYSLLLARQVARASEAAERAFALDPRGPQAGSSEIARAWVALLGSDAAGAEAALRRSLELTNGGWTELPHVVGDPPPNEPDARPLVFLVGAPGRDALARLPFARVLEAAAHDALALARTEPTRARRLLDGVVAGLRTERRERRALELLREHAALVPDRFRSTATIELELLRDVGDADEVAAHARELASSGQLDTALAYVLVEPLLQSADPADRALASALASRVDFSALDVFFSAGRLARAYDALALEALARGDVRAALHAHRLALYDRRLPEDRVRTAQSFFERVVALRAAPDVLVAALDLCLRECATIPRKAANAHGMRRRAELLLGAWPPPPPDPGALDLDDHGPASETFERALAELVR